MTAELPPFVPGVFQAGASGPVLLGSRCGSCQQHFFPACELCPDCLSATSTAELGAHGRIYSHTVVRTKPPLGLPAPYAVGYVDLDDCGLRVFALLDPALVGRLQIGLPVRLAVAPLGTDQHGQPCLRPYFTAEPA
ncbi:MAG: DNA-binding protein [Gammaproteobacteria bacterium]|nr:DNA-binding protein [Gammaproteobacteria bacterium]